MEKVFGIAASLANLFYSKEWLEDNIACVAAIYVVDECFVVRHEYFLEVVDGVYPILVGERGVVGECCSDGDSAASEELCSVRDTFEAKFI